MSFLFRLRILNLFIKVVFPDRHHLTMSVPFTKGGCVTMGAVQAPRFVRPPGGVPGFVEDVDDGLTEDEIGACNGAFRDAWKEALDDPDVIANTRNFLIRQWERQP